MTKTDFVKELSKETGFKMNDLRVVLKAINTVVFKSLHDSDEEIPLLTGFYLYSVFKETHEGKDPRNGETIVIPARRVPKIKVTNTFKRHVADGIEE